MWSLTRDATVLNVHEAYSRAPDYVLDAFARIAVAVRRSTGYRAATRTVRDWPGVEEGLREAYETHRRTSGRTRARVPCVGSEAERERLRALYVYFNTHRFDGQLPSDLPLRLSDRMKSRLGHVAPREKDGVRRIDELAINRRLLRVGNEVVLHETLLHEMAHVAAYLIDGEAGHGPNWRRWAQRVGCAPTAYVALKVG